MRKLSSLMALLLFGCLQSAHSQTAAPLGITLDDIASCKNFREKYQTKINPNSTTTDTSGTRRNSDLHDVIKPSDIYPNARNISVACLNDKKIHWLFISINKVRPNELDSSIVLSGLKEKYKFHSGDKTVDEDGVSTTFTAGRVEIRLESKRKDNYLVVQYFVHETPPFELTPQDMQIIQKELDAQKKLKAPL